MWRLTLAQMRRSLGRLTAAGIAVAIGTAFVAATLLAGDVMQRISYDSLTASYGTADVIADAGNGDALTEKTVDAVRATPGVKAADPRIVAPYVSMSAGDRAISQTLVPVASDPAFDTQHVTAGALPTADGEIALPERAAERLGVGVGDTITVSYYAWQPAGGADADDAAAASPTAAPTEEATAGATGDAATEASTAAPGEDEGTYREVGADAEVVGLTTDPTSAWAQYDGAALATTADTLLWAGWGQADAAPTLADAATSQLLVAVDPGADTATVIDAVEDVLTASGTTDPIVLTRDAAAERALSGSDGTGPILVVVLAFAAVAMIVAGLVIANTFQVLVAQRTRTLALLRCVGAVRSQVRGSVLLEAGLLGLAASVAGTLLGTGLVQIALLVMQNADLPFPVPTVVRPTVASVVAPLAVGLVVTVLAALTPARVATRVAPIAALRPADAPAAGSRAGRFRLVVSLVLVVGGALMLAGGVALSQQALVAAVGVAILGGAASFVGLLVGAVFWMPRVVAAIGGLVGRLGMPARLAAANTGRNPARTAATSTALLIGVTLVAMMSTGAVTARATLDDELDTRFPVDLAVASPYTADEDGTAVAEALPAGTVGALADIPGVESVAALARDSVEVGGSGNVVDALGITPEQAADVLRDADLVDAIGDGTVVMPRALAASSGIEDGDTVALARSERDAGSTATGTVDLTAVVVPLDDWTVLVTPATLDAIGSAGTESTAWLRVADINDSGQVVQQVQDLTADSALDITGAALERALYQRAIDTLLAVVVGLLAVAVVIALIGVTNTLSLSVIERRRESATLRALGLTRRQLRASMAVEGALIAGVGAVVGVALGLAYGWLGSAAVLAGIADLQLRVPWADLGLVLGVALVAGVLASALPGRTAARTPPVAALAVD
ncbi:FtsX-like permease family protein [Cellulomonas sp. GbtcB1]|uniref:ABC transporter permease n=1 Tax=Cellulomonas sp. GbtcB1 TaxID=2824746 RepID=UPI001C305623|nr:FtsX-like permease family protein [Cellulomonas sp. GbtcB1]